MFNRIELPATPVAPNLRLRALARMAFGLWLAVGLAASPPNANGSATDDNYYRVYALIDSADELRDAGKKDRAIAKYTEAQKALKELREVHPNYNPKLVNSRLLYLANQLEKLNRPPVLDTPPPNTNSTPALRPSAGGKIELSLLTPGAEPRTEMRLRAVPETRQDVRMGVVAKMEFVGAEKQQTIPTRQVNLQAAVRSKEVKDAGVTSFEVILSAARMQADGDIPPEVLDKENSTFQMMTGAVFAATIDGRYLTREATVSAPPGATREIRSGLEEMKDAFTETDLILPEEAIGIGARWQVRQSKITNGLTVNKLVVHELVAVADSVLTIKSTGTETSTKQKAPASLFPGLKADQVEYRGSSLEDVTLDLTKIMPIKSIQTAKSELVMYIKAGKESATLTLKGENTATLETR
jgi:hypothetical protein